MDNFRDELSSKTARGAVHIGVQKYDRFLFQFPGAFERIPFLNTLFIRISETINFVNRMTEISSNQTGCAENFHGC